MAGLRWLPDVERHVVMPMAKAQPIWKKEPKAAYAEGGLGVEREERDGRDAGEDVEKLPRGLGHAFTEEAGRRNA
jgi:hypothetical protein